MILNPIDFKNYIYCPRQIYYKYIYKLELEPTIKMIKGKELHYIFSKIEKRRGIKKYGIDESYKREFNLKIYSEEDELNGEIDMVFRNEKEIIPVDFKMTETSFIEGYIIQVYSYSRLLKSKFKIEPKYGFIIFVNTERIKRIDFDDEIEKKYYEIRSDMIDIIKNERFPDVYSNTNCSECEYINFCRDVE